MRLPRRCKAFLPQLPIENVGIVEPESLQYGDRMRQNSSSVGWASIACTRSVLSRAADSGPGGPLRWLYRTPNDQMIGSPNAGIPPWNCPPR